MRTKKISEGIMSLQFDDLQNQERSTTPPAGEKEDVEMAKNQNKTEKKRGRPRKNPEAPTRARRQSREMKPLAQKIAEEIKSTVQEAAPKPDITMDQTKVEPAQPTAPTEEKVDRRTQRPKGLAYHCKICGQQGHNSRSCPQNMQVVPISGNGDQPMAQVLARSQSNAMRLPPGQAQILVLDGRYQHHFLIIESAKNGVP